MNLKEKGSVFFNKIKNNPSFTLKEQLGFASGLFGNTMGQDMVGTFITLYLTDFMGILPKTIIFLMFFAKIVNIITDPIIGMIIDNQTGRKIGAKQFTLLAPLPLSISSVMLFVIPADSMTIRIVWVFTFYLLFCIADTLYDTSMLTISARMTTNPNDRKNFYTVAELAGSLGSMLPGGVIPVFISMYKNDHTAQNYIYLVGAIIFGVVGLATMIVPYFTLTEKIYVKRNKKEHVNVNLKAIFLNRPLLLLVLVKMVESIRQICYGSLAYFYKKTLNAFWLSSVVGAFSITLSYVGLFLVPILGKKVSSRNLSIISYLFTGMCYILLFMLGYKYVAVVGILISLAGLPNAAISATRKIMLADSIDYMEWKTYKKFGTAIRSEAMVFAVNSMGNRISQLWKDLLLPAGLSMIGYVGSQVVNNKSIEVTQSPETLYGIFLLVVIPGIVGNILPAIILLFDNYTGKNKENILNELDEIRTIEKENGLEVVENTTEKV